MRPLIHILPALLLLTSCSADQPISDTVRRLDITFADQQTRSTWEDRSDTETGRVSYIWDNYNTNMLAAIRHKGRYVPFYENSSSAAQYHTPAKFWTIDLEKSKIKLQTTHGVKYDIADGAYTHPVAAGDEMYCLHPINSNTQVSSSEGSVTVDMQLPSTFSSDRLVNDLTPLAPYSYVYTATTLQSVSDNSVVANTSHFNSACAIIRFNVTNAITSDIIITDIKMESADHTPLFPNVLRFADGTISEQADKSGYYNKLTTTIDSVTLPRASTGVFYNMCFPLDGDFGHVPLKFTIDTNYLTYQLQLDTDVITNHKFEAGKLYTFNFTLEEKEIRLNTIDIARCTTYNTDNAESLNIIVSPESVWHQTGNTTAQMVFVSLGMSATINGKDYDVLWATCNLGALEPIETGNHYAWGEVKTKAPEHYSPTDYTGTAETDIRGTTHDAVRAYLGDGYWLWSMPSKEMWEDIIRDCTWTWKTVKKVADGNESEENLDFDASVWEVKKTAADGKLTGIIYLPITGYSGYDSSSQTYGKVTKAMCCYWTSTPSSTSTTSGATEKSAAFVTTYIVETGTGNGHMSDHTSALQDSERYRGYAIRPVLLKEKK